MNFTDLILQHKPQTLEELKKMLEQMLASNHPDREHAFVSNGSGLCEECGFIQVDTPCSCGGGSMRDHARILLAAIRETEQKSQISANDIFIAYLSIEESDWLSGRRKFSDN